MQGLDLIFYGDSITESWRGTDMNNTGRRSAGIDRVYAAHFSKYRSIVLAIAGENKDDKGRLQAFVTDPV